MRCGEGDIIVEIKRTEKYKEIVRFIEPDNKDLRPFITFNE